MPERFLGTGLVIQRSPGSISTQAAGWGFLGSPDTLVNS